MTYYAAELEGNSNLNHAYYQEKYRLLLMISSASCISTTGLIFQLMSAASAENAFNIVTVCAAVEMTRFEGADVEGVHKILLASKGNKLDWNL